MSNQTPVTQLEFGRFLKVFDAHDRNDQRSFRDNETKFSEQQSEIREIKTKLMLATRIAVAIFATVLTAAGTVVVWCVHNWNFVSNGGKP